ncbi:MAG: ribosome-associated translation inhibitor RaiA [Anaerolineae bacterium]|nr:ribosome-associated translation inhibitor RaiA [Candidatus Roseilinea sp.]MDW8451040.1 ribosome-associated translation inhibitor RaiA [Anaerolineae bacterium]
MQVSVQGHNMNVSQRLDKYVRSKTERLQRYLPGVEDVRVEFTRQSTKSDVPKSVELTVRRRGTLLRVEEHDPDPFKAFDFALEKMYHRIARYKGRRIDRKRSGAAALATEDEELLMAEALPIEEEEAPPAAPLPKLVRVKTFQIVPMSVEEAIEQMELLGHDFFVFVHADDSRVKVVYRRRDGDYGLLQPEK